MTQFHKKIFKSFRNIFAMRRMQSRNLKFKRCNINRSRKFQNAKWSEKLQIYWKNEIIHTKTNESLHQNNNAKEKNSKAQLRKEKRKRKNINIRTHTRTHAIIWMRRNVKWWRQSTSLKQSHQLLTILYMLILTNVRKHK